MVNDNIKLKKEIGRLRSEVRKLQEVKKDINPFTF